MPTAVRVGMFDQTIRVVPLNMGCTQWMRGRDSHLVPTRAGTLSCGTREIRDFSGAMAKRSAAMSNENVVRHGLAGNFITGNAMRTFGLSHSQPRSGDVV